MKRARGKQLGVPPAPRFFATQAAWRTWLERHHGARAVLWVGFHKVGSGKPSITWPQSVDEALCFGWIDGMRRSLGGTSYAIRFTPRRPTSIWSRVNLKRFAELSRARLVRAAGRAAWRRRSAARSGVYSFEQERTGLDATTERRLRADRRAWAWWSAQAPSYRRNVGHWVTSAKREETRQRRLATLVASCRKGRVIPPLEWTTKRAAKRTRRAAARTGRAPGR